jgi:rhomboid family GlyGly-CTERM serine protease
MQEFTAKFRRVAAFPHPAACALLVGTLAAIAAAGPRATLALRYERAAVAGGEWWRLLTGNLVHYDLAHLGMNLTGLVLLWILYAGEAPLRATFVMLAAAALAVGAGLYLEAPDVTWYLGLSGVLHGAWAGGAVARMRAAPAEGAIALALLGARLTLETRTGSLAGMLGLGMPVLHEAHAYGALGGGVAALALAAAGRWGARL